MNSVDRGTASPKEVLERYRTIGVVGGGFLGALVGLMVAGPHFRDWELSRLALTMGGSLFLGLLVGYIAAQLAAGGSAGCDASGMLSSSHGDSGHCADSGGCSDGGSGGGDGGGGGDS